ncbi:DDE superfamily endonuclease domain-containing protein [Phthorimaea operculella]|nr:DDE superfamily endonuclease domain-containing protein [Phthorimaea operculella]
MTAVPLIASVLHPLIIQSTKKTVKRNLPIAFRHKYHHIYCIIDCLEIEIQKSSKSVEQTLTWSQYKKANTAKYLISSTPDGVINYISPGYSGRITDVLVVQICSLLDYLEPGVSILADRGFKHIEEALLNKGINLERPPTVTQNSKMSKQDVIRTKQIASLRIHIERVIRRLREFSMLKPHSVVNKKLLKYLDDCVVIACALINLQDSIIKNI